MDIDLDQLGDMLVYVGCIAAVFVGIFLRHRGFSIAWTALIGVLIGAVVGGAYALALGASALVPLLGGALLGFGMFLGAIGGKGARPREAATPALDLRATSRPSGPSRGRRA